jgi:hypothetical protein
MLRHAEPKEQYISDLKITKILSTVPHDKEFYFYAEFGRYTGEAATDLVTFAQKLETINADSVNFHFQRNDYQNWIKTTVGDNVLADRIDHVSRLLPVEDLRKELFSIVQTRIAQLKLQHGQMIRSQ